MPGDHTAKNNKFLLKFNDVNLLETQEMDFHTGFQKGYFIFLERFP